MDDFCFAPASAFGMERYVKKRVRVPQHLIPGGMVTRSLLFMARSFLGGDLPHIAMGFCDQYLEQHRENLAQEPEPVPPESDPSEGDRSPIPLESLLISFRHIDAFESSPALIAELEQFRGYCKALNFIREAVLYQAQASLAQILDISLTKDTLTEWIVQGILFPSWVRTPRSILMFRWIPSGDFRSLSMFYKRLGIDFDPPPDSLTQRFNP